MSFCADSPSSYTSETDDHLPHFCEISGTKPRKPHQPVDNYFFGKRCKNWEEANETSERKIKELQRLGYVLKKVDIWYRDVYGAKHFVRELEF